MKNYLSRASNLKSTISFLASVSLRKSISGAYKNRRFSLIPLHTTLPEICAFVIGFSCTEWTKMTSLAGSLITRLQEALYEDLPV